MDEEKMQALLDALNAVIDARLMDLDLITSKSKSPVKGAKPEVAAKPKARGKGKQVEPEHTVEELKEKLVALVEQQDKQAAVDALSRFGCKKLADVKPSQIDEFFEYLEKKIENEEDPADAEDPDDTEELFG